MQLVFDISMIAGWDRATVGIVRVERELARRARDFCSAEVVFSHFDRRHGRFLALPNKIANEVIEGHLTITGGEPAPAGQHVAALRRLVRLLRDPRGSTASVLDRLNIRAPGIASAKSLTPDRVASYLNALLGSESSLRSAGKESPWQHRENRRISLQRAGAMPLPLSAEHTVISCAIDILFKPLSAIYALKRRGKFKYVGFCHDLIPLRFPQFVPADFLPKSQGYFSDLFWTTDLLFTSSLYVERDIAQFCIANGIPQIAMARLRPGADLPERATKPAIDIEPGGFILYVSSLERRKNHRFAYEVWRRIRQTSLAQKPVKMVLAGETTGQMPEAIDLMTRDPVTAGSVTVLGNVPDGQLRWLYDNARFCIHPSIAEGYGIPIGEALAAGKVCVCSTAEAIVEQFGEYAPCIPVEKSDEWVSLLSALLLDDSLLKSLERKVIDRYRAPSWDDCARQVFGTVQQMA